MKICKDIWPDQQFHCYSCKASNLTLCWVERYKEEIELDLSQKSTHSLIKRYKFLSQPPAEYFALYNKALELYYPELYNKLEKLMVLL
jgi:hypothetical protein